MYMNILVYMYICICICIYIYTLYIYIYTHTPTYVYIYMCFKVKHFLNMHVDVSLHICMYVCMCVCVYMYACVSWSKTGQILHSQYYHARPPGYTYILIYIHTYIHAYICTYLYKNTANLALSILSCTSAWVYIHT